jgi:predicted TIM-barrel fold metal-dependent hydrolase
MGIIDCHAHLLPLPIAEGLRAATANTYFGRTMWSDPGFTELERHIALMDRYDVEAEVIEYGALIASGAPAAKMSLADAVRLVNDHVSEACRAFPGRFIAAAAVDPFGGPDALRELDRAVEQRGLYGISLTTNVDGRALDDQAYEPIFERARSWDMPIWVHPGFVPRPWQQALDLRNRYLNSGIAFLLDDTLCLIKMITAGTFDRWWGVKFVFCQLGGFLPFAIGRFDQQLFFERRLYEQEGGERPAYLDRRVADYCQAFYVDTHTADAAALQCALACMTADRIVLGGDYPVSPPDCGLAYTLGQLAQVELSEADRAKITRENAARLLGRALK